MAEKNIRVFKGLNSVTDPSFLDEAGGQLVWAENIDFRSGKIRALPNSEELESVSISDSTAFTAGASETTADRGTFWYYDQLYQASSWAQQDSLYWTVYNEANKDYLFVYSSLDDRVPFTSNGWSDGYLRKKIGVPTYLEVKPNSQTPDVTALSTGYNFHSLDFDPRYAISFTQNFLGNVEEGGLTFLNPSEFNTSEVGGTTLEAYSLFGRDSISLTSYSNSITPTLIPTTTKGSYSHQVLGSGESASHGFVGPSLLTSLSYSSGRGATKYALDDVPNLGLRKATVALRVDLDSSFLIEDKIYGAIIKEEETSESFSEAFALISEASLGLVGIGFANASNNTFDITFNSTETYPPNTVFAWIEPYSGMFYLFKVDSDDSGLIVNHNSTYNLSVTPLANQVSDLTSIASEGGQYIYRVFDPTFNVLVYESSTSPNFLIPDNFTFDVSTNSTTSYAAMDHTSDLDPVQLDIAFSWDQSTVTNGNRNANVGVTLRTKYGGQERDSSSIYWVDDNHFNLEGYPYSLLLGGPGRYNWEQLSNTFSFTLSRNTGNYGGVARQFNYSSITVSSGYFSSAVTGQEFDSLFAFTNPDTLIAASVDFPQTDPQNNNVSEFTSGTTGEGSDIFPYGYTTHQNVYRLFNGEYLLMERLPLWVPDISYTIIDPDSGDMIIYDNTGGLDNDSFTVTLGSDLQASFFRPEFTVFTTGDIVRFRQGYNTPDIYYRYLGFRKLIFGSVNSQTFYFKDSPNSTATNEIESIFTDSNRSIIDPEFWEVVTNIDFVNKKIYDKVLDENLGDQSNSFFQSSVTGDLVNYTSPPKDLDGIANALYANMAFAWKGSRLYWSETLLINSWAEDHFYYNFPDEIMGVVSGAEQLTVITRTSIHTTTNRNPEEISFFDVANIGAISKYAVSNLEGNPVFISAYGVVLATRGGYDILTKDLLPDDVFKAADVGPNRTLNLDKLNACIGVYRDHIYFHLPNAGLFDLDMRSKNLTPLKIKENVTGRDLGVTFFHDFYDDKIVAVTKTMQDPQKLIYTSLVESFNAPPALAYSEWVAHSADCDLNRTDWKQFESLQFQGSGDVEVVLLDSDSVISYSNPLDMSAETSDDYVFPVVNQVQADNWSFTTGDDFITSNTAYAASGNDLSNFYDVGDLVYLCLNESKGDSYSDYYRIEAISTDKLYFDRPITFDATFTSPLTGLRLSRSKTQRGVSGECIYFNKGDWNFKRGSKICVKHPILGQAYFRYKGNREFIDVTYGFIILSDSPQGNTAYFPTIHSVFLSNGNFNSQYWEPIGSSAKPWSKVLDITDQYGASLGQGLIDDTITLPKNTSIHKGMILHGKQKNGRQYWAQYLGNKSFINTSDSDVIITMVKEYIDSSTQLLEIESVMLHEDQIYQPYINVFPYTGHKIDFTNLDGSRIGVPFDCPVDRLSFIIRGTGKVIGVTINGF